MGGGGGGLLKELIFFLCASNVEDVHFASVFIGGASKLDDLQLFIQLMVNEKFTCMHA